MGRAHFEDFEKQEKGNWRVVHKSGRKPVKGISSKKIGCGQFSFLFS